MCENQAKRRKYSNDLQWQDLFGNPGLSGVAVQIFTNLDYKSLLNCSKVAKSWAEVIHNRLKKKWSDGLDRMKSENSEFFRKWNDFQNIFTRLLAKNNPVELLAFYNLMSEYFEIYTKESGYPLSPLHFAAKFGRLDQIKLLELHSGGGVLRFDDNRRTPFIWACWKNRFEVVEYYVKKFNSVAFTPVTIMNRIFYNINHQDSGGMSGFLWAALKGNSNIVRLLLNQPNLDVNLMSLERRTAFIYAAFFQREEIVDMLLKAAETRDFDLNVIDRENNTAWDYWPEKFNEFRNGE